MDKKGKIDLVGIAVILLALGVLGMGVMLYMSPTGGGGGGGLESTLQDLSEAAKAANICPTDLTTSTEIEVRNILNETSQQEKDVTFVCLGAGGQVEVINDTTNPTAVDFDCNVQYTCKPISSGDSEGDQGKILTIEEASNPSAQVLEDDSGFSFTPIGGSTYVAVGAHEQGAIQVRVWDDNERSWACAGSSATCGTWNSTDGATFGDTTDGTAFVVTAASGLELCYEVQATDDGENVNDRGIYVLVDAATTVWKTPDVTIDGVGASNFKGSLNEDEATSYSDYEYVYKVEQDKKVTSKNSETMEVCISLEASSDAGASDDVSVDFSPIATYRATDDDNTVKLGAVTDADPPAQVHTLFDTVIDVS